MKVALPARIPANAVVRLQSEARLYVQALAGKPARTLFFWISQL